MAKKVVIIGATSGIGRALAAELHARGFTIGATGRRRHRLKDLQAQLGEGIYISAQDVEKPGEAFRQMDSLTEAMGGMDILVINAGVSNFGGQFDWPAERRVVDVNVRGFTALANYGFRYFERQGHGHIVGVSSIAALFPYGLSATYNASKAFVSTYLAGCRQRARHSSARITVTDLQPGFVESEMTEGKEGMFWVANTAVAARQMADAIEHRRSHAYITRRWRLVAWLLKLVPGWVWNRI